MVVIGLGGQVKDALHDLRLTHSSNSLFFYTDFENDTNIDFFSRKELRVIIGEQELKSHFEKHKSAFICFIGNNYDRERVFQKTLHLGGKATSFISQSAHFDIDLVEISKHNVIIMDNTHISAGAIINEGSIIYTHSSIAHDVIIGKYAFVSAYCAISNSSVGAYTFVGLNTMIGPGVEIGKNCIIGANSYVKHNLPDGVIAVGSPAKIIGENTKIDTLQQ